MTLLFSNKKPAWVAGAAMLGVAKILENMEIGHNVMHGQWDWMNDPEIHSSNWEWDTAQPAEQWKHSHNYVHHQFTNVLGYDNDIGYGVLRMAREQKWHPANLGQPVYNALLASLFQWGVALHDLDIERIRKREKDPKEMKRQLKQIGRKIRRQIVKDYVVYPALSGPNWKTTMTANATANLMRNLWSYMIIFCGHFPDGAMHFTEEEIEDETRAEWYLRQLLGSANFEGGRAAAHHVRQPRATRSSTTCSPTCRATATRRSRERVRALCDKYDLPYTTGPLYRQYGQALRTIMKLSLPNHMTKSNQPTAPQRPSRRSRRPPDRRRKTDAERQPRAHRARRLVARGLRSTRDGLMDPGTTAVRRAAARPGARARRCRSPAAPVSRATRRPRTRWTGGGSPSARSAASAGCAVPGLGRPIAFLGSQEEVDRNAFHFPPDAPRVRRAHRRGVRRRGRAPCSARPSRSTSGWS